MRKLLGATGSAIGNRPFDISCWSGSSYFFFNEMKRRSLILDAVGVVPSKPNLAAAYLRNLHSDKTKWRNRFYLDLPHRDHLTKRLRDLITGREEVDGIFQIGGYFDGPSASNNNLDAYAYYDGNLTSRVASGYDLGASDKAIARAIDYEKQLLRRMKFVFTFSEFLRKSFIADYGVDESRVINVGAGINWLEIPDVPAKDYRNKEILFIGKDFIRKGGDVVLSAFSAINKKFPDAVLHIVGPSNVSIPEALTPKVRCYGLLSKADPVFQGLMNRCVLFVMPSRYEPFGIAPLEAMAHAMPAIVTGNWALQEMVQDGLTGAHVPPNNDAAVAEAAINILADTDRLKFMGLAARDNVLQYYTWSQTVERISAYIAR